MQGFQQLFKQLLKDIGVELTDEFKENFIRKSFFNVAWKAAKHNTIGSLMMRTGALRQSISNPVISNTSIKWESSLPYADILNHGGKITVTQKMRRFFWYKYRMATGGNNKNLNAEALFWKAMALKKIGSVIVIEKRQFIGDHPQVHTAIKNTADYWVENDLKPFIDKQLNDMIK